MFSAIASLCTVRRSLLQYKILYTDQLFNLLNEESLVKKKESIWTRECLRQILYGVPYVNFSDPQRAQIDMLSSTITAFDNSINTIEEQMKKIWRGEK